MKPPITCLSLLSATVMLVSCFAGVGVPQVSAAPAQEAFSVSNVCTAQKELSIPVMSPDGGLPAGAELTDGGVAVHGENTVLNYRFTMPTAGQYALLFTYRSLSSKTMYLDIKVAVNGAYPQDCMERLVLKTPWALEEEDIFDRRGNQMMPGQTNAQLLFTQPLYDPDGTSDEMLLFPVQEGENTLTVTFVTADVELKEICLATAQAVPTYNEYQISHQGKADLATQERVRIDAEKPTYRSDSSILPQYERTSAGTDPSDPTKLLINTIGGSNWSTPRQWITYTVEVPRDGYYALGVRYRQNIKNGMETLRRLSVDGQVPFAEAAVWKFPYAFGWKEAVLGGEESPQYLYLTAGTHTISLEVVVGEYGDITKDILAVIGDLNDLYRQILMITGSSPDTYRDYHLKQNIPTMNENLEKAADALQVQLDRLISMGKRGSVTATLEDLLNQLHKFTESDRAVVAGLEYFRSNISSVSSWVLGLNEQPLELDYLELYGKESEFSVERVGFFGWLSYNFRAIINTFVQDYSRIGDSVGSGDELTVWVSVGRDQAQIIKQLVDERYSRTTDTGISICLVQTGLLEATMAGNGPDVSLFIGHDTPIKLASRNAAYDLSKFAGYDQLVKQYSESSITPYRYNGGVYGLPMTQVFPMLFYRTDVFQQLNIQVPETWDDLYKLIPIIQGKNMNIGLGDVFSTLLFQLGGNYYNEDITATEFDSPAAIEAFTRYTELYTMYGLPISFNLYNRFRTGEMPLAIGEYSFYTQLYEAAPEIRGLWDIAPVPGVRKADGTVDHTVAGSGGYAAIILKKCEQPEKAWDFLRWFADAEIQVAYGQAIEARLGTIGRYATANRVAFAQLPTPVALRDKITAAWDTMREVEQMPASYYVTRNVSNAFRRVIYYYENPRHTLYQYNRTINKEIARKLEEMERYFVSDDEK